MIDHLFGRPSPSWKRVQVFLVIFFWLWRLKQTSIPPHILWFRKLNQNFRRFSPWQIIVATLTAVYALRNFDQLLGLGSPEPLAGLYSPSYYRATWVATGLDAGFATAMSIRPKWLRDICSILFSFYYILYAHEGDEKLRRFRAVPTVEMLRTTWEKTSNPLIRLVTYLPKVAIRRKILLPRPKSSSYQRPIAGYLFSSQSENELTTATELILDFPGGGFVAMSPEHHEERLRMWATRTGKPVLSIDYGKAPEYPYPYAIDEAFDVYVALVETVGTLVGMSGKQLTMVISGDSAGATLAVNVVFKILEHNSVNASHPSLHLPLPRALVLNYAALDFNFTSWMKEDNLRVLRSEQSSGNLPGLKELAEQKDHLKHVSPLSMVGDKKSLRPKQMKRRSSWKDAIRGFTSGSGNEDEGLVPSKHSTRDRTLSSGVRMPAKRGSFLVPKPKPETGQYANLQNSDEEDEDFNQWKEEDRPLQARVRYFYPHSDASGGSIVAPLPLNSSILEKHQEELSAAVTEADMKANLEASNKKSRTATREPIGTRLTMTSRTGYFQDRIVSPSMMRAMAILYIGPHRNPDFANDYHLSPILAPSHLLAQFPPLLMQCGEKDPFVDDTVIFAGRIREAKRARKIELDLALSGKSARFGESLRMSTVESSSEPSRMAMKRERGRLIGETEDDWVQLVLFSEWSHGYLQMPTLMAEAKAVIDELADWIDDVFSRHSNKEQTSSSLSARRDSRLLASPQRKSHHISSRSPVTSETETDDLGITFVPKRTVERASVNRSSSSSQTEQGDSNTLVGDGMSLKNESTSSLSGSAVTSVEMPGKVAGATRPTGQTITETELMRRRRLLDSHIFDK